MGLTLDQNQLPGQWGRHLIHGTELARLRGMQPVKAEYLCQA
jgi:hypothetical protein